MKRNLKLLSCFLVSAIMIGAMLSGIAFATENEDDIEHVCVYSCETGETQVMRIDDFIAQNRSKNGKSAQIASDEVSCPAVPPENGPAWAEQNNQNDGIDPQDILGIGDPWRECDPYIWGVASIRAYFRDGHVLDSSAFVFAYQALATAGHAVYDKEHGGLCERVEISCSRNGDSRPYGIIKSLDIIVCQEYMNDERSVDYDYAIIQVKEEIGRDTGLFGFGGADLRLNNDVACIGYPGYLDSGSTIWANYKQYYDSGKITHIVQNKRTFTFNMDTNNGCSGGPVFAANHQAVGIISTGIVPLAPYGNKATGIIGPLYSLMLSYRD